MDLQLTNVVNISVSQANTGVNAYNTSNLALFSHDTPGEGFGALGYKLYLEPTEVATDFGSSSTTYKMALAIFSQQPNILAGGGALVVIPVLETIAGVVEVQAIEFSTVPTAGSFKLQYDGEDTTELTFESDAAAVQDALQALTGLATVTATGNFTDGFVVTYTGVDGPAETLTAVENSLQDTDGYNVFMTDTVLTPGVAAQAGEDLDAAITRTKDLVQYFGILVDQHLATLTEAKMLLAAAVVQALNKIAFFVSYAAADVAPAGSLDKLRSGSYTHSRGLLYIDTSSSGLNAILMAAAYAGRALSVDFTGSRTTATMHLKTLATIDADPGITQTILALAQTAGVDCYVSLQGVSAVFCSGENYFFDQVYNLLWFAGALQVAGFNYLVQSNTKIPQTESGMDGLKGAYRSICEQAVLNNYSAPGTWTSPNTFGNQADLLANITQAGYYIYSLPVGQQTQVAREARQAPLVQIALKEAGAIHSSNVVVNINA